MLSLSERRNKVNYADKFIIRMIAETSTKQTIAKPFKISRRSFIKLTKKITNHSDYNGN